MCTDRAWIPVISVTAKLRFDDDSDDDGFRRTAGVHEAQVIRSQSVT